MVFHYADPDARYRCAKGETMVNDMGDEFDDPETKWAALQFHLSKVTLAKAALAGVTYEPIDDWVPGRMAAVRRVTKYIAVLPDGRRSHEAFNDELEAAIWALTILDPYTPVQKLVIPGFELKPENEQ
jgi:hypothetical protein